MNFHKDNIIKLDYNPVLDAQIDYLNAVGATDSLTLRTLDFTPADANTIFVAKTGSDSTGTGTQANPVLTIKKAESLITATKVNIVILDDGVYEEESLAFDTNCVNIAAAIGKKPTVKPILVCLGSSNYFVGNIKTPTIISTSGTGDSKARCAALTNGNFVIIYHGIVSVSYGLYFQIIDKNGNIIVSETFVATSNDISFGDVCSLESGNFVIAYDGNGLKYYVYTNDGSLLYASATIGTTAFCLVSSVGGYDDRVAIVMDTGSRTYYTIVKIDGSTIFPVTLLTNDRHEWYGCLIPRPSGGFVLSFKVWGAVDNRWYVVDSTGSVLNSGTVLSGASWCCGYILDDNIIFACSDASNNLHFIEYSLITYTVTKTDTVVTTLSDSSRVDILGLRDGNFVVAAGSTTGSISFITRDWIIISTETVAGVTRLNLAYNFLNDRLLITYTGTGSPYESYQYIKGGFLTDWWTFSANININGIIFDNEESYIKRFIWESAGTITIKWCDFLNIIRSDYNDGDTYPLYVMESSASDNQISNCKIFECHAGFNFTSNSVLIQWCQFFKQLLGSSLKVTGAGSGIIVNHNDFLYNYICVELEDNNGSEVLKNNIYHTSLLYSIKAETAVSYINSIENGVSLNATPGTQVIRSNPHYINDGYVSLAVMDLILKSRELGYRFESPAIGIGDDLKNAGSVEYDIAGGSQTWDTMTVVKPAIKRGYNPVGAIETPYKDGSVESYRDSYTEVLKLEWDSLKEEDFLELLALYFSSSNLVRIYLDPVREPGTYGTYVLIYDKVNASPKNWQFDDIGKNDFDLTFKRAYNEGV